MQILCPFPEFPSVLFTFYGFFIQSFPTMLLHSLLCLYIIISPFSTVSKHCFTLFTMPVLWSSPLFHSFQTLFYILRFTASAVLLSPFFPNTVLHYSARFCYYLPFSFIPNSVLRSLQCPFCYYSPSFYLLFYVSYFAFSWLSPLSPSSKNLLTDILCHLS